MNEQYLALLGGIAGRYWWGVGHWDREGSPYAVTFDHNAVLERHQELVGFFHTHPTFSASPSGIDIDTMFGWTVALGRPLVCCIAGKNGLKYHWFIDDETPYVSGFGLRFGRIFVGRVPKKVLKWLRMKEAAKRAATGSHTTSLAH